MLNRLVRVIALPNYRLAVEFDDGSTGTVDLTSQLSGPMFEPLRERALFDQATVDDFGAVCWPNGADLAPDALYRAITGKSTPEATPKTKQRSVKLA